MGSVSNSLAAMENAILHSADRQLDPVVPADACALTGVDGTTACPNDRTGRQAVVVRHCDRERQHQAQEETIALRAEFDRSGELDFRRILKVIPSIHQPEDRISVLDRILEFAPFASLELCRAVSRVRAPEDLFGLVTSDPPTNIDRGTLYILGLSLSQTRECRSKILRSMSSVGVRQGAAIFGQRILVSETFSEAFAILNEMRNLAFIPAAEIYRMVAEKAENFDCAYSVLTEMQSDGSSVPEPMFWTAAQKGTKCSQLKQLAHDLASQGLPLSRRLAGLSHRFMRTYNDRRNLMEGTGESWEIQNTGGVAHIDRISSYQTLARPQVNSEIPRQTGEGLSPNTDIIRQAHDYDAARLAFDAIIDTDVRPTEAMYSVLAEKSKTYIFSRKLLDEMTFEKISPTSLFFETVLNKSRSPSETSRILRDMNSFGVNVADDMLFGRICQEQDFGAAMQIFDIYVEFGNTPGIDLFAALADKVTEFPQAIRLLHETRLFGMTPPKSLLSCLSESADSFVAAGHVFSILRTDKSTPSPCFLLHWMDMSRNFREAVHVWNEISSENIRPPESFFGQYMEKAPSFAGARQVLIDMRSADLSPGEAELDGLLRHIGSLPDAHQALEEARLSGIVPADTDFLGVFKEINAFEDVQSLMNAMQTAGIAIGGAFRARLANLADSFDDALIVLEELRADGVVPGSEIFNALAEKASTFDEKRRLLAAMCDAGVQPGKALFMGLRRTSASFRDLLQVYERLYEMGYAFCSADFAELAQRATRSSDAGVVLDRMDEWGVQPHDRLKALLLRKMGATTA